MVIDGRALAHEILDNLTLRVRKIQEEKGFTPHMGVLRVGNDAAITSYINQKKKMAKQIGALISVYEFPEEVTQRELEHSLQFLIDKGDLQGLIVQLPMPEHIDGEKLINMVPLAMDIDGFRKNSPYEVPIALAVEAILERAYLFFCHPEWKNADIPQYSEIEGSHITATLNTSTLKSVETDSSTSLRFVQNDKYMAWLKEKSIVVIGKGKTAGEPIIEYLRKQELSPIVVDRETQNSQEIIKTADIIISAVGKQEIVKSEGLKRDVILIGVGLGRGEDGKVKGDYNEEKIQDIASCYTPTPGGVGPVNVAKLMENLVISAEMK